MTEYKRHKVFSLPDDLLKVTYDIHAMRNSYDLLTEDVSRRIIKAEGPIESKKNYFYNIVCSFDIETSNVVIAGERVGVMYIWQFLIGDIIVYGRDWASFEGFCRLICNVFDLAPNVNLFVFVHNLSFEFTYLRSHLYFDCDPSAKKVYTRRSSDVLTAFSDCGLVFRDSYAMSNKGLEATVEELYLPGVSKLKYDYNTVRTSETLLTEDELEYCLNDVYLVEEYVLFLLKEYKYIRRIPWTMTGMARKRLEKYINSHLDGLEYKDFMKACRVRDEAEFDILNNAMHGGLTFSATHDDGSESDESYYEVFENIHSRDANSFYGAQVVLRKFPYGEPTIYHDITEDELWDIATKDGKLNEDKFVVINCVMGGVEAKFTYLFPMQLNHIKTGNLKTSYDYDDRFMNGKLITRDSNVVHNRIHRANVLSIACTFQDFVMYDFFYNIDEIRIIDCYVYETRFLPKRYILYMLKLYREKETAGTKAERNQNKTTFNSLAFGAHAMSPCRDEFGVSEKDGKWYKIEKDVKQSIEDYNKSNRMTSFIIGVAITAFARYELFMVMRDMKIDDIVYIDTDGIKYKGDYDKVFDKYNRYIEERVWFVAGCVHKMDRDLFISANPKKKCYIGQFLDEGDIQRFCSLSTKKYIMERNGVIEQRISGLPKAAQAYYDFDNFVCGEYVERRGFVVPKSFLFPDESGRKESVQILKPVYGVVEDCQGHKTFCKEDTSVYICDAPFCLEPFVSNMIQAIARRKNKNV